MYTPAGALLTTSSNGLLRRTIPADGVYTLLVRDRGGLNLGSYRVNLQDDTNTCAVNDTEGPMIVLVRPTGGEVLPGGTTFRIQWLSDDNVEVAAHAIALSTDGGKTFADLLANLGGNSQAYDWICLPISRQPHGGPARHRLRCRRQCAIRHERLADLDRLRLYTEQQCHLLLRRAESTDPGVFGRWRHDRLYVGCRRQSGLDCDKGAVRKTVSR
jgi:hypothetical protein